MVKKSDLSVGGLFFWFFVTDVADRGFFLLASALKFSMQAVTVASSSWCSLHLFGSDLVTMQVSKVGVCQICERCDHLAPKCPFIYTKCKMQDCVGIRMLKEANTTLNKGRKFLKCQHISCAGFQWLDNAIEEFTGSMGSSSKSSSYSLQGCFLCGSSEHWKVDCPWSSTNCKICQGILTLKVSGKKESEGRRYLKCGRCGHFEWFAPVANPTTSITSVKMTLEGSLDDLCNMFQNTCSHK